MLDFRRLQYGHPWQQEREPPNVGARAMPALPLAQNQFDSTASKMMHASPIETSASLDPADHVNVKILEAMVSGIPPWALELE